MVAFASPALAPDLSFLIVAVLAVPACFLAGYAATQVPGFLQGTVTASRPGDYGWQHFAVVT